MFVKRSLIQLGTSLLLALVIVTGVQAKKPAPSTDPPGGGGGLSQQLGKLLFQDASLSEPPGQSCQSCHDPSAGFADPAPVTMDPDGDAYPAPVSMGVNGLFGTRNAPSAGYAGFTPDFTTKRGVQGGQFWDGRAADLAAQARGPFLNEVEMANTSMQQVIDKVGLSDPAYEALFEEVCGPDAYAPSNEEASYICLSEAIAAYERTSELSPFTSKFDAILAGAPGVSFTPQEQQGFDLFTGNAKCAHCHIVKVGANSPILFTDFKYHNVGLPANPDIASLREIAGQAAPDIDLGLGATLDDPLNYGKFKDPHLRNIALTAPYMHNGVLRTLKQVVHFYNTRDTLPLCDVSDEGFGDTCWAEPEIPETMDSSFLGNLNLTGDEEDAIVAFLETLTDGYYSP